MERDELLEKYADTIAADSCVEAYIIDGALYYRYEGLNEIEMIPEIISYVLDGNEEPGSPGTKVPLGRMYKAQKNGEKVK